jgi:2,3-bisphosphoglycerate-dependent phosphoglycerate mutase
MNSKIIFIRHEETQKDSNINASKWVLSEIGHEQASKLANKRNLQNIDVIYTSSEIKTVQTIKPLADKLNIPINQVADFDEVRRGAKFLTTEEFEREKFKQLEELDYPAFGGETANQALLRFEKALEKITSENKNKTIVVVSHGTILNLYFAKILDDFESIKERWNNTKFGTIGEMSNGKVIKDIVTIKHEYPNIEKFLANIGIKVFFSDKEKLCLEFIDDSEIDAAEREFHKAVTEKVEVEKEMKRVWKLRNSYEKKLFPKLSPLVTELNNFYMKRETQYKYQIFLHAEYIPSLEIGPNPVIYEYFKNDKDFRLKIFQELLDFDKFLEH